MLLRHCTGKMVHALQCGVCPLRFITSVQNTQLLCTVLVSMAQTYRSIVEAIDAEADLSRDRGETKTWTLGAALSGNTDSRRPREAPSTFALDVSPEEWKVLAKKIVKAEIAGTAGGDRGSFLDLVNSLEARQVRWHASPPCPDFPKHCIHGPEKTPFCILHCRQARKHVRMLQL